MQIIKNNKNSNAIIFTDGREDYKLDLSKSTLYKRFITEEYFANVDVRILSDPLKELENLKQEDSKIQIADL